MRTVLALRVPSWLTVGACFGAACGGAGQSVLAPEAGPSTSPADANDSSVAPDAGGGATVDAAEAAKPDTAIGSSDGGSDAPDARAPSSLPDGACGRVLDPDAAPNACFFTPADVACDVPSDCVAYPIIGCGCLDLVMGVNKTSNVSCPYPEKCVPQIGAPCPNGTGFVTHSCEIVQDSNSVLVACVDHQCVTYAAAGSD